jgi:hypothetical protein
MVTMAGWGMAPNAAPQCNSTTPTMATNPQKNGDQHKYTDTKNGAKQPKQWFSSKPFPPPIQHRRRSEALFLKYHGPAGRWIAIYPP